MPHVHYDCNKNLVPAQGTGVPEASPDWVSQQRQRSSGMHWPENKLLQNSMAQAEADLLDRLRRERAKEDGLFVCSFLWPESVPVNGFSTISHRRPASRCHRLNACPSISGQAIIRKIHDASGAGNREAGRTGQAAIMIRIAMWSIIVAVGWRWGLPSWLTIDLIEWDGGRGGKDTGIRWLVGEKVQTDQMKQLRTGRRWRGRIASEEEGEERGWAVTAARDRIRFEKIGMEVTSHSLTAKGTGCEQQWSDCILRSPSSAVTLQEVTD